MKRIILKINRAYGRRNVYPACETSALLLALTGAKTFSQEALMILDKLGYEVIYANSDF